MEVNPERQQTTKMNWNNSSLSGKHHSEES